ncbi:MAG: P1 family peptidase [Dehalococcoidia bacterium]|nr:P1 family peptidase [Dehalococcoidia bacterium]
MNDLCITSVPGIRVGHYTDTANATGCTVVLCEDGAVGGVDVRGSAPGTLGTDSLAPTALVEQAHAVVLSGGSAFGLNTVAGVVSYLEEKGVGIEFGNATIPIVSGAILFDLGLVNGAMRPGPDEGRSACLAASSDYVAEGSVGAGTGATVAKLRGRDRCVKGGIGTSALHLGDGLMVGAIVAVNAVGGVVDPETSEIVAGPLGDDGSTMLDSMALITAPGFESPQPRAGQNTTIGVVATNASLTKSQASKLADVSHDGLAMAVRPAHLMSDGDTMFALATGSHEADANMNRLCAAAALCTSRAIVRAIRKATGLGGVKAVSELKESDA